MFELKKYQKDTLDVLKDFLLESRLSGSPSDSFVKILKKQGINTIYKTQELGNIPYACLRLPTGGGKTLLASYSIKDACQSYLEKDFPLVLWLVPTNTIREQTIETLKDPRHSYRKVLDEYFEGKVAVFDIADVVNIRPHDLGSKVCIVVGTLATLRVQDTTGRKIYADNESFEPHFERLSENISDLEIFEEGEKKGKVKHSFANLCHIYKPLIIMDEAHNARTVLTYDTLKRVSPSCIIEFTATPNTTQENGSNILYSVTASELKTEDMIKLPIMLSEHQNWQEAVKDTILTRKRLEILSKNEEDFIRPIALYQAENKDREITVAVLKKHLIESEKISPETIAIVTGSQKELEGIDLFDPKCKIEHIITIEALKEGWDCSFAYVFCSVAHVRSSRDVEQILGRVLRMPYAKKRKQKELNCAYAHVSSPVFSEAARQLRDNLVNMGFEDLEANAYVQPHDETLFNLETSFVKEKSLPFFEYKIEKNLAIIDIPETIKDRIEITQGNEIATIIIRDAITDDFEKEVLKIIPKQEQKQFLSELKNHRIMQEMFLSPANRGQKFQVPRLCVNIQGELELAEKEIFLDAANWNILNYPAELSDNEFKIEDKAHVFEIDIEGRKVVVHHDPDIAGQLLLKDVITEWTELDLVRWLDKQIRQSDILQIKLLEFIRKIVHELLQEKKYSLTSLFMAKYLLSNSIIEKISKYRQKALKDGYQNLLFKQKENVEVSFNYSLNYETGNYPVHEIYRGSYKFNKHFFNIIDVMNDEELECAKALDRLPEIKYWVRNIARQPDSSFWLPTSTDNFYPDFVAELNDGRILVLEYKGSHMEDSADTLEKQNIGHLWEEKSNGNGLFLIAVKEDKSGKNVFTQIEEKIKT